eukprot:GHUV01028235.1.p1 GENE.GHUV01028235.1~~GHUV01028235.1.p1  ORF type:complete len:132 (+),score=23.31 GHUV01028235.1:94-489(+)
MVHRGYRRNLLAASVVAAVLVGLYVCVQGMNVRDQNDDLKVIREAASSAAASSREMEECQEPVVDGQAKTQWPELVGEPAQEALDTIKSQAPGFNVQTIGSDMMATTDWRCDRVRIWLDSAGNVARAPRIG